MRIVLLGPPGSGKRTQTKLLVEKYGIAAVATGDLIKTAMSGGSALGKQVEQALDTGQLVSDEIVLELIRERLLQADARDGFILDGFPRNILQEITLDELLAEMGLPIELVLLIDIETDDLMERLVGRRTCRSCGTLYNIYINPTAVDDVCDLCGGGLRHRADDNEETISSRLHVYDHLTAPLLKYYEKQQKLHRIDGCGEVDEIFERICQVVDTHASLAASAPLSSIEPAEEGQDASEKAPAKSKKKVVVKKTAGKKKSVKKPAGKKQVPASSKKAPAKKKQAKAQPVTKKKKAVARKVSVKNQPLIRKKVAKKKKIIKKQVVKKISPVKKKTLLKKKVVSKKKVAPKNTQVKKKKQAKKKALAKKVSRKR